ncbi:hypothetical protein O1L55_38920 [Streptomyces albulus]|nr:hypothetical protein [Streptomyces noursei]
MLGALAEQGALEPPVLQAADAVLGIGGRRLGEGRRQHLRRHLPAQHRAWLSAMDRHCAPSAPSPTAAALTPPSTARPRSRSSPSAAPTPPSSTPPPPHSGPVPEAA